MRLIEKVWFYRHPAKWLLVTLLLPLTIVFALVTFLRRLAYRFGIKPSFKTDLPVVVIGNIGVGGNGKTPLALHLIELCQQLKINVGVISRGYGGKAPYYPYLLDDNSKAEYSGDEPLMIYQRSGVPVVVGSDRIKSIAELKAQGCQLVLADDGLQHYRLQRESEIIVVDGKRGFGNGLLMPAGPLRELPNRLKTGNLIVVNGGSLDLSSKLTIRDGKAKQQLNMSLSATNMVNLKTGEKVAVSEFCLQNNKVNALAAIGDPQRFFTTLSEAKFQLDKCQSFVDHHKFQVSDFALFDDELPLIMTEKDAVKCGGFAKENWWYLAVSATFNKRDNQAIIDELKRVAS